MSVKKQIFSVSLVNIFCAVQKFIFTFSLHQPLGPFRQKGGIIKKKLFLAPNCPQPHHNVFFLPASRGLNLNTVLTKVGKAIQVMGKR